MGPPRPACVLTEPPTDASVCFLRGALVVATGRATSSWAREGKLTPGAAEWGGWGGLHLPSGLCGPTTPEGPAPAACTRCSRRPRSPTCRPRRCSAVHPGPRATPTHVLPSCCPAAAGAASCPLYPHLGMCPADPELAGQAGKPRSPGDDHPEARGTSGKCPSVLLYPGERGPYRLWAGRLAWPSDIGTVSRREQQP